MPGLCPKSTDLGVKPSAPSSSLTLPLDLGLAIEQAENQDTFPVRVASVLVEIQTVPILVKLSKRSTHELSCRYRNLHQVKDVNYMMTRL